MKSPVALLIFVAGAAMMPLLHLGSAIGHLAVFAAPTTDLLKVPVIIEDRMQPDTNPTEAASPFISHNSMGLSQLLPPLGPPFAAGPPLPPGSGGDRPSLPGLGGHFGMFPPPGPVERGLFLPPRLACEDGVDRHMALAAYLKGKLRLQGVQRDAWQKIELAAEPALEKLRDLCAKLPTRPTAPPSLPDAIDMAYSELSARLELLHAIREPLRAVFDVLSADQRAMLAPPVPLFSPGDP